MSNQSIFDYVDDDIHQKLDLEGEGLQRLPDDIDRLNNTDITSLNLSNNQLTFLPDSIGNLRKLEELYVSGNQLISLPESICNLKNLYLLVVDRNQIVSIPERIGDLHNLTTLFMNNNQIVSIPESIEHLQFLEKINLEHNRLSSLPESIGDLQSLEILEFGSNSLSSLPESIGNLQNLGYLDLKDNQLASLPESMGNLQNLYTLILSGNPSLTRLPESIVNLTEEELEINIIGTGIKSLPANLPANITIVGMEQIVGNSSTQVFISDTDCEGQEDPVSLEPIPKGRGFRLDADKKCYDANVIRQLVKNNESNFVSPLTRAVFTKKDLQRKRTIPFFQDAGNRIYYNEVRKKSSKNRLKKTNKKKNKTNKKKNKTSKKTSKKTNKARKSRKGRR